MVIDRAYIGIDGPSRAGKTALVERLLESNRSKIISAARFVEAESLAETAGEFSEGGEMERFKAAGAYDTVLFRHSFDNEGEAGNWFWESKFMTGNYSNGIIVEGRWRLDFPADLTVFVTRPLARDEHLLLKDKREVMRLSFKDYISAVTGVEMEADPIVYEEGNEPDEELFSADEVVEEGEIIEIPDEYAEKLLEHMKHGYPVYKEGWFLKESHVGLADASVVVINIFKDEERPAAERLAADIQRIRKDEEICRDIIGHWVSRRSQSVYIANLADRRDKELQKAIARIKRMAFYKLPNRTAYDLF